jgi:uncharacterized membrane protein YqiK
VLRPAQRRLQRWQRARIGAGASKAEAEADEEAGSAEAAEGGDLASAEPVAAAAADDDVSLSSALHVAGG